MKLFFVQCYAVLLCATAYIVAILFRYQMILFIKQKRLTRLGRSRTRLRTNV